LLVSKPLEGDTIGEHELFDSSICDNGCGANSYCLSVSVRAATGGGGDCLYEGESSSGKVSVWSDKYLM
jgi:hypothetical protein